MTGGGQPSLRQALAYAECGWPVFPCVPGEKVPATRHGVKDASCDSDQIRDWWGRNPARNVAIATGRPGPDVLDIDRHGDASGFAALGELRAAGLVGHPAAVIRTPSGGAHLYFLGSEQGNGTVRGRHIDFRGAGGYVLAPPSTVGGRPYVVVSHGGAPGPIDWARVREYLDPQPEPVPWTPPRDVQMQKLDHLVEHMAAQGPDSGNRNQFLFWAANRALDHGQPVVVERLAQAAVEAGLPRREVERTIASARRTPRQDPRAGPHRNIPERADPLADRGVDPDGTAGPACDRACVAARPGDLVVAQRTAGRGPGAPPVYDAGVVTRTDPESGVTAHTDSSGCTRPVAFLAGQPPRKRLVHRDAIAIATAQEAARMGGPFHSFARAGQAIAPLSRQRQPDIEAGA